MSSPSEGSNKRNIKGKFTDIALHKIDSEVEKFESDLLTRSATIRSEEDPTIDINKEHVQKALMDINKDHVLNALNKSQVKPLLVLIIVLIITDITLPFYNEIFILGNSVIQYMNSNTGFFNLIILVLVVPLVLRSLYVKIKKDKKVS